MRELFDYCDVYNEILESMQSYFSRYKLQNLVIGLSGGLDSTVVAALAHACKVKYPELGLNIIGVSLPSGTNGSDEISGANKCKCFCDEFYTMGIESDFIQLRKSAKILNENVEQTALADGNIKARIRMIHLYNVAGLRNGIVLDTDNLTENYLGFFTIHGDVADYNPIGDLWKSEVYKLADWMKHQTFMKDNTNMVDALNAAINITPTDGNGVKSGGDMEQIAPGCTYEQVDEVLYTYINTQYQIDTFISSYGSWFPNVSKENIRRIIERYQRTHFKRQKLPIKIGLPSYLWDEDYYAEENHY